MNIWFLLGLKKDNFSANLKSARDETRGFERDWKNLNALFKTGGLTFLITSFYAKVIERARSATGEIDENTAAVRRFGEALDENRGMLEAAGVQVLGYFNRAGEAIGIFIKSLDLEKVNFWKRLLTGDIKGALLGLGDGFKEIAAREAEATRTARELEETQKALAARNKPGGLASVLREEEKLRDIRRDSAIAAADASEKSKLLQEERVRLEKIIAATSSQDISNLKAQQELERVNLAIKQNAQVLEKEAEAAARVAATVRENALDEQAAKNEKIAILRLKGTQNLTAAEKAQLDVLEGKVTQRQLEAEIASLLAKGVENLTDDERARLSVLVDQTAEIDKQNNKVDELTKKVIRLNVRGFAQFEDASDEALQALIDKSRSDIQRSQEMMFQQADRFNFTGRLNIARLQQEITNAQQELDFRRSFRRDLELGGEENARRNFKGDPLRFDEVLSRLTGNWDKDDETNETLRSTNRLLEQIRDRTGESSQSAILGGISRLTDATKAVAIQLNQRGINPGT